MFLRLFIDNIVVQSIVDVITAVNIVTSEIVTIFQLYGNEQLKEAEFIVNFNTNFISNPKPMFESNPNHHYLIIDLYLWISGNCEV